MKKTILFLAVAAFISCNNNSQKKIELTNEADSLSYAIGADIANNLMKQNQNINQEEDRLFLARKNNLEKIIQMGVDPYPKSFERSHLSTQVIDDLEKFEKNKINESLLENSVIAGRITAIRGQGKMIFIDLKDYAGTIQVAAKEDVLKDLFQLIRQNIS